MLIFKSSICNSKQKRKQVFKGEPSWYVALRAELKSEYFIAIQHLKGG